MMDMADTVRNPQTPDVYLFSYFYDSLKWAGLVREGQMETVFTVRQYFHAAKTGQSTDFIFNPVTLLC
jgi:hypothetical protein